jgi:hypothetical protein
MDGVEHVPGLDGDKVVANADDLADRVVVAP